MAAAEVAAVAAPRRRISPVVQEALAAAAVDLLQTRIPRTKCHRVMVNRTRAAAAEALAATQSQAALAVAGSLSSYGRRASSIGLADESGGGKPKRCQPTIIATQCLDMRAIGRDVAIGSNAYVTAGRITGAAPQLPVVNLTV